MMIVSTYLGDIVKSVFTVRSMASSMFQFTWGSLKINAHVSQFDLQMFASPYVKYQYIFFRNTILIHLKKVVENPQILIYVLLLLHQQPIA